MTNLSFYYFKDSTGKQYLDITNKEFFSTGTYVLSENTDIWILWNGNYKWPLEITQKELMAAKIKGSFLYHDRIKKLLKSLTKNPK